MSWIKDAKDSLIELGRAAGVLSTVEERSTDVEVRIEENKTKIVNLKKEQNVTWAKAAMEIREMGVTQDDFDLLNSINPFGKTVLPKKSKRAETADAPENTDVEVPANDH
jgi:hypothetical protein